MRRQEGLEAIEFAGFYHIASSSAAAQAQGYPPSAIRVNREADIGPWNSPRKSVVSLQGTTRGSPQRSHELHGHYLTDMSLDIMATTKFINDRSRTRNGTIRVEAWGDVDTGSVKKYNLAYINECVFSGDNGRILGFDNSHVYPGFASSHHGHCLGLVFENRRFVTFADTLKRFERHLRRLRRRYGREY